MGSARRATAAADGKGSIPPKGGGRISAGRRRATVWGPAVTLVQSDDPVALTRRTFRRVRHWYNRDPQAASRRRTCGSWADFGPRLPGGASGWGPGSHGARSRRRSAAGFLIHLRVDPTAFLVAGALSQDRSMRRAGVRMLPGTHGERYNAPHVLLYTVLLLVVSVLPFLQRRMSGVDLSRERAGVRRHLCRRTPPDSYAKLQAIGLAIRRSGYSIVLPFAAAVSRRLGPITYGF